MVLAIRVGIVSGNKLTNFKYIGNCLDIAKVKPVHNNAYTKRLKIPDFFVKLEFRDLN